MARLGQVGDVLLEASYGSSTRLEFQLGQLQPPTLLLIGDREVIYDPDAALEWARQHIPRLEGEIVPGASHMLTAERAKLINQRLLAFLRVESAEAVPA